MTPASPQTTTTSRAARIIARCRELARITDIPGQTTRLFLSPATRDAHTLLTWWIRQAGLTPRTDDAGNLRATRRASHPDAPTLVLFSHIDTVPNAGAFDGPLGVLLALAAIEELGHTPLPFQIELIAFAEEEGARFGFPFLSSLAAIGQLTPEHLARTDADGITVAQAIRNFTSAEGRTLDPGNIPQTCPLAPDTFAALEVHIEQGPVLESEDTQLAVVEAIVGQSRFELTFTGQANHAGTTPMALRHDALAAAAQWIVEVERYANRGPRQALLPEGVDANRGPRQALLPEGVDANRGPQQALLPEGVDANRGPQQALLPEGVDANYTQLVATVGQMSALPGAMNVVPGTVLTSLDVRHPSDFSRHAAVAHILTMAEQAANLRGVTVHSKELTTQRAVPLDPALSNQLQQAAARSGHQARSIFSGAGHDAMILATAVPTAMLFVRSPGGLSHHPDETVREEDVEAALATVLNLLLHLQAVSSKPSANG